MGMHKTKKGTQGTLSANRDKDAHAHEYTYKRYIKRFKMLENKIDKDHGP